MAKIEGFLSAWRFLENHHMFQNEDRNMFLRCLEIKVEEATVPASGEGAGVATTRILLRCSKWCMADDTGLGEPLAIYEPELDSVASTFEEAIVMLANLVYARYAP